MTTLHEQARAEAEKRYPYGSHPRRWMVDADRAAYEQGFLAGHEAASRPRVVETVAELDALPVGSVVRLGSGQVFTRDYDSTYGWFAPGYAPPWAADEILAEHDEPARVLYVPKEES